MKCLAGAVAQSSAVGASAAADGEYVAAGMYSWGPAAESEFAEIGGDIVVANHFLSFLDN